VRSAQARHAIATSARKQQSPDCCTLSARHMRGLVLCALITVGAALPSTSVEQVNAFLRNETGLLTAPCEGLSIHSIRLMLKKLLSIKHSDRTSPYPIYATEAEMKEQWKAIPAVKLGDNRESRLVKYAHCHEAVMWYTQHLSAAEKKSFSHGNFLPLLPTGELPVEDKDVFTKFYASKVKCNDCNIISGSVNAVSKLRTVPCEDLSIFSLRVALKELFKAKSSPRTASYPMYATEAEMRAQWRALPGVQPGDNPQSRLVRYAHCHEAVNWYKHHLSEAEQQAFARTTFLPLLPAHDLPVDGNDLLTQFYVSKAKCAECTVSSVIV